MSKFSHIADAAAAAEDDARAMTIPRRFFSKTAELKMFKTEIYSTLYLLAFFPNT